MPARSLKRTNIRPCIVNVPENFSQSLLAHKGIYLGSEDSLYNADKIDVLHRGLIAPESVNLQTMKGNARVVEALERMIACSQDSFFPGTVMQDFGGYYAPVMPIIIEGKMVGGRIKLTSMPYIDDEVALARRRGFHSKNGVVSDQHRAEMRRRIALELEERKVASVASYLIDGTRVLPVLGNELTVIPQYYKGSAVSVILHSAVDYLSDFSNRMERYKLFMKEMTIRKKITDPVTIAYADRSTNPEVLSATGVLRFQNGMFTQESSNITLNHNI